MFRFSPTYPIDSPAVQFVVDQTHQSPVHPVRWSGKWGWLIQIWLFLYYVWISMYIQTAMCVYYSCALFVVIKPGRGSLSCQICASILGTDWSPVLSVVSVCVTLQSMLASCKVWIPSSYSAYTTTDPCQFLFIHFILRVEEGTVC